MLTKNDLTKIKSVVHDEIDTIVEEKLKPIKRDIEGIDVVVENKLKPIKRDLRYLRKTVSIIARNYDEGDVKLERRVRKIEKHLALP